MRRMKNWKGWNEDEIFLVLPFRWGKCFLLQAKISSVEWIFHFRCRWVNLALCTYVYITPSAFNGEVKCFDLQNDWQTSTMILLSGFSYLIHHFSFIEVIHNYYHLFEYVDLRWLLNRWLDRRCLIFGWCLPNQNLAGWCLVNRALFVIFWPRHQENSSYYPLVRT